MDCLSVMPEIRANGKRISPKGKCLKNPYPKPPPLYRPNYNCLRQSVDTSLKYINLSFSVPNFRPLCRLTLFNVYYSLIVFSRHGAKLQEKIHIFQ